MRNVKISWAVLILLGALMGFLRYGNLLTLDQLRLLKNVGPYAVLVIHITLVMMAYQDTVFQGILATLVPLYSFYWLFIVSDAFLIRAIVMGLLVGIGQDSAAFYQAFANEHAGVIRDWIASGGGE